MSDASTRASAAGDAGGWEDLARAAASAREGSGAEEASLRQLLCFELAGAPYALPVESVREIVRIRPIAPVPRVPDDVRGVISLRGEILQVVDLRKRISLPATEPTRASRIVVVRNESGEATGLLVDAVREVLRVGEDAIRPANAGDSNAVEAICLRGDRFVSLIDLPQVLEIDAER